MGHEPVGVGRRVPEVPVVTPPPPRLKRAALLPPSEWFRPYVAGFYAWLLGEDLSRPEVEARLEELLRAGQPWLMEVSP